MVKTRFEKVKAQGKPELCEVYQTKSRGDKNI